MDCGLDYSMTVKCLACKLGCDSGAAEAPSSAIIVWTVDWTAAYLWCALHAGLVFKDALNLVFSPGAAEAAGSGAEVWHCAFVRWGLAALLCRSA